MSLTKRFFQAYKSGILAGFIVVIGASTYLISWSLGLRPLGAVLFSVGLIFILYLGFGLYTGKIGYALAKDGPSPLTLLAVFLGNATVVFIAGYLFSFLRLTSWDSLFNLLDEIALSRMIGSGESWYIALINGFFCGIFVFLAVHVHKIAKWHWLKNLGVIVFIVAFVFTGTEHCVANIYFYSLGNNWNSGTFLNVIIIIIGNSLGALFIWFILNALEISRQKR